MELWMLSATEAVARLRRREVSPIDPRGRSVQHLDR